MAAGAPDIGSLLAGLGGGGAPPDLGAGPGGPGGPPQGGDVTDLLQQAFDLIHEAVGAEKDPTFKEMIGKALMAVQAVLSAEQKDKDQAMGGGGNLRLMRRG